MPVRSLPPEKVAQAASFAWKLFSDIKNRSYPIYKSENALLSEFKFRCADPESELLAFYEHADGDISGIMSCFSVPAEKYLQTVAVCVSNESAISEFLCYLDNKYPCFTAYIGAEKANRILTKALLEHGYSLIEESLDMEIEPGKLKNIRTEAQIKRVDRTSLHLYLEYHSAHFEDAYWDAGKISANFGAWNIYAAFDGGKVTGGLFMKCSTELSVAEIYGVNACTVPLAESLLSFAVRDLALKNPDIKTVMTMVGSEKIYMAASAVGFDKISEYCCFCKKSGGCRG